MLSVLCANGDEIDSVGGIIVSFQSDAMPMVGHVQLGRMRLGCMRLGRMRYAPTAANFDDGMKMVGHNDKIMKDYLALSYVDGV